MTHRVLDSVSQIATGTGTGALTLGAVTSGKYKTAQAAGLADGDSMYGRLQHPTIDAEWECVLLTRSGGTIVRTFDSKSVSATGALINFTAGNKTLSGAVLSGQLVTIDADGNTRVPGDLIVAGSITGGIASFEAAVQDAWDNDRALNWTNGNVTLTSPIVLQATESKFGFGIRGNGARIFCDFNDEAEYAITMEVPIVTGDVLQGIAVRNWEIADLKFQGVSAFAGALQVRCLTNGSWFYSFLLRDLSCDAHSGYAYYWNGSVFECIGERCKSSGGLGGMKIERAGKTGLDTDPDMGLPSAMQLFSPNFRDGSEHGIYLYCVQTFTEPFDLSINGGYIVTMGGNAVVAPAGMTMIDNLGIEFMNGGAGCHIGYRGCLVKGETRGANAVADAAEDGPGLKYLVFWWAASGRLLLEDLSWSDEGSGSGIRLAKTSGSGTVYMNRCGPESNIDNSGCTVTVQAE